MRMCGTIEEGMKGRGMKTRMILALAGVLAGLLAVPAQAATLGDGGQVAAGEMRVKGSDLCLAYPYMRKGAVVNLTTCKPGEKDEQWVLWRGFGDTAPGTISPAWADGGQAGFLYLGPLTGNLKRAGLSATTFIWLYRELVNGSYRLESPAGLCLGARYTNKGSLNVPFLSCESAHVAWVLPAFEPVDLEAAR